MKRKVFLIRGASNDPVEKAKDEVFMSRYESFFKDNAGGAYKDEEVIILSEPTLANLKTKLEEEKLDYAIAVFLGHGAEQDSTQIFKLNDKEVISPGELDFPAAKQLVILESCRMQIAGYPVAKQANKVAKFKKGGTILKPLSEEQSRDIYDEQISSSKDGLVVAFACSPNEKAYNYIFSNTILTIGDAFHNDRNNKSTVLGIQSAFPFISAEVTNFAKNHKVVQTPLQKGDLDFPVIVSKY